MQDTRALSRRSFLGKVAITGALYSAAPWISLAASGKSQPRQGPNGRIHLGIIGCGSMGCANLAACSNQPDVVVTAACDVISSRREAVVQKFKETCRGFHDFREMLAQADLDAVIIATPPHWHTLMAVAACEAGKDIYVQKPMTLHLGESLALRNAVRKHRRISQVGTQIHAGENYRRVVEFVRSGNLGDIGTVRTFNVMNQAPLGIGPGTPAPVPRDVDWDLWCGPGPLRPYSATLATDAYHHSSWMAYSGGWTPGMAPHIIDLPVWALDLGFPLVTSSSGGRYFFRDEGDAYDHHEVLWQYPKLTMTWMSSLNNSYGFDLHGEPKPQRRLGIYFHGSNGTLYANYSQFKIVPEGDRMAGQEPPPRSIPPSPGHEREWLDSIHSRRETTCNIEYHTRVDVPVVLSLLSLKLGRSIRFDPHREWIVDDSKASRLAVPTYRAPWRFPKQYL